MKKFVLLFVCLVMLTGCTQKKGVESIEVQELEELEQIEESSSETYTFSVIENETVPIEDNALRSDICDVMGWVATDYNLGFPEFTADNMDAFEIITSDYRILYDVEKGIFDVHIFDDYTCYNYEIDSDCNVTYIGKSSRSVDCGNVDLNACIEECVKKHKLNIDTIELYDGMIILNNYGDAVTYRYKDDEPAIEKLTYCDISTENVIEVKY